MGLLNCFRCFGDDGGAVHAPGRNNVTQQGLRHQDVHPASHLAVIPEASTPADSSTHASSRTVPLDAPASSQAAAAAGSTQLAVPDAVSSSTPASANAAARRSKVRFADEAADDVNLSDAPAAEQQHQLEMVGDHHDVAAVTASPLDADDVPAFRQRDQDRASSRDAEAALAVPDVPTTSSTATQPDMRGVALVEVDPAAAPHPASAAAGAASPQATRGVGDATGTSGAAAACAGAACADAAGADAAPSMPEREALGGTGGHNVVAAETAAAADAAPEAAPSSLQGGRVRAPPQDISNQIATPASGASVAADADADASNRPTEAGWADKADSASNLSSSSDTSSSISSSPGNAGISSGFRAGHELLLRNAKLKRLSPISPKGPPSPVVSPRAAKAYAALLSSPSAAATYTVFQGTTGVDAENAAHAAYAASPSAAEGSAGSAASPHAAGNAGTADFAAPDPTPLEAAAAAAQPFGDAAPPASSTAATAEPQVEAPARAFTLAPSAPAATTADELHSASPAAAAKPLVATAAPNTAAAMAQHSTAQRQASTVQQLRRTPASLWSSSSKSQQLLRLAASRTELLCAEAVIWASGSALLLLDQGPHWVGQLMQVVPQWAGLAVAAAGQLTNELTAAAAEGVAQLDHAAAAAAPVAASSSDGGSSSSSTRFSRVGNVDSTESTAAGSAAAPPHASAAAAPAAEATAAGRAEEASCSIKDSALEPLELRRQQQQKVTEQHEDFTVAASHAAAQAGAWEY